MHGPVTGFRIFVDLTMPNALMAYDFQAPCKAANAAEPIYESHIVFSLKMHTGEADNEYAVDVDANMVLIFGDNG